MTTCVNQEKKGYAGKAVSATLAGVLAVGMVPASALAAVPGGSDVAEDAGVETLATTAVSFAKGELTFSNGTNAQTYEYNGSAQGLRISKVTPPAADVIEVNGLAPSSISDAELETAYYKYVKIAKKETEATGGQTVVKNAKTGADGTAITYTNAKGKTTELYGDFISSTPVNAGEYAVVACYTKDGKTWNYTNTAGYFVIDGTPLSEATLFDGSDVTDTTFEYTGEANSLVASTVAKRIGVAINNIALTSDDVTVEIWDKGGTTKITSADLTPGTTYVAKIKGVDGGTYDGQVQDKEFTIEKLNLSTAVVEGDAIENLAAKLAAASGSDPVAAETDLYTAGFNELKSSLVKTVSSGTTTKAIVSTDEYNTSGNTYYTVGKTYTDADLYNAALTELVAISDVYVSSTEIDEDDLESTTSGTGLTKIAEGTENVKYDSSKYYYTIDATNGATAVEVSLGAGYDAIKGGIGKGNELATKNTDGVNYDISSSVGDEGTTYYILVKQGEVSFAAAGFDSLKSTLYVAKDEATKSNATASDTLVLTTDTEYNSTHKYYKIGAIDLQKNKVKALLLKSINAKAWTTYTLAKADGTTTEDTYDDKIYEQLAEYVDIKLVSTPKSGIQTVSDDVRGAYTYEISVRNQSADKLLSALPTEDNDFDSYIDSDDGTYYDNKYITGSAQFTVYNVDAKATINFGSNVTNLYVKGTPSVDDTFVVNLSPAKGEEVTYFDLTQITANYGATPTTIKNKDLTITVTDADGKTVDADTLKTSGTYYVTASVADTFDGQFVAGSQTVKVVVTYANPGENNVFVTYNGQNVDTTQDLKLEFTGKDQATDLSYLVKNASGDTLVEGKDYEVVITAIKDGKIAQVDEIVDAGDYTVTVKGLSYTGDVQFVVVVNPATVTKITPDYDYEAYLTYVYTGDVITPTYKFGKSTGAKQLTSDDYDVYYVMAYDKDGKPVEHPSGIDYTDASDNGSITTDHENQFSTLDATDLKEEGTYYAYFKLKDGVTNFKISDAAQGVEIRVSSERVFLDVPNGEWYTNYVYNANKAGYVYGYNNTKFFGPNDEIKRGDVVVILARMAGFSNVTAEDSTNELRGYLSNFDDVDNGTYYAHAIAWANKVGIVTGTSATTFEPERSVTREEFVTMLQRYANLCEDGGAVAASTATELAKYADGSAVCDWAKDAVAWASENEIMTGYAGTSVLGAENTVTRAQVAKMVITYQPKALSDVYATLQ